MIPPTGTSNFFKTYFRIYDNFFWTGMRWTINRFFLSCHLCETNKRPTQPPPRSTPPTVSTHWNWLPWPFSPNGNKKSVDKCSSCLPNTIRLNKVAPGSHKPSCSKFLSSQNSSRTRRPSVNHHRPRHTFHCDPPSKRPQLRKHNSSCNYCQASTHI